FHAAWANSKAMRLLGISKKAIDPVPGFSYYKRDNDGNPTGYLLEGTASSAVKKLGVITVESVSLGTADVIKIMNSYGITSVFDAGVLGVESMQMDVLSKLTEQGKMTVRIVGSHMVASSESMKNAIEITANKKATSQHGLYHINTLKIMNDGTIEGKTAGMFEDYQGESEIGNKGETVFSQQQLNGLVSKATEQDIDVHIHALGERTIFETLNAIEFAQKQFPNSSTRYTICHLQVMTDQSIQRMAQLNVIAQSTPLWASYDEYGKAFVSDDQFQRYFRFNSLNKAGVKMAFGSDYPATGAGVLGMSPIFNMEIGHTRQAAGKADAPIQPNINERLEMQTLIKAYTIDGAYQLHMEDQIGSIKVGKQADFVILNENLFEVESYSIHKVKVVETILAGKTIYNVAN
ncbi:MAG: amidohydrolase family protein, partial [Kangiellaceae bacterium]|nr:amidohydrolase family protein [Kangiellaceae bacterium]